MENIPAEISKIVEEMALELVMSDMKNKTLPPGVVEKMLRLSHITAEISDCNGLAIHTISTACSLYMRESPLPETGGETKVFEVVSKLIPELQALIDGRLNPEEIDIPAELGLSRKKPGYDKAISELCEKFREISYISAGDKPDSIRDAALALANILEKARKKESTGKNEAGNAINDFIAAVCCISNPAAFDEKPEIQKKAHDKTEKAEITKLPDTAGKTDRNLPDDQYVLTGDPELLNDFIAEAGEHIEAADSQLLILEHDGGNQDAINTVFRCFHTLKSLSSFLELHDIFALVKETEGMLHKVRKGEILLGGTEIDILFEIIDILKKQIKNLKEALIKKEKMKIAQGLNEILSKIWSICGSTTAHDAPRSKTNPAGGIFNCVETGPQLDEKISNTDRFYSIQSKAQIKEMLKIDSEKLDRLIDTIGEIVIAESMIKTDNGIAINASGEYIKNLGHLNKTTKRLHELGLSLRLVPLNAVFQKMARIVRDLAKKHNKEIEFIVNGEDTEIDRTVVEKISDPLVHMLRNAVDHGIENKEERKRLNKPDAGTISLNAYHKGGNVFIEVSDDGKGLNREKIMARAFETGLITHDAVHKDFDVYNLIFKPGFSTSSVITDTSGRGVGMDVVKRNVEELHGKIDIFSEKDKGVKFTISMPLTTAIIEAMVVRVGAEKYLLPTLSIVESVKAEPKNIYSVEGKGLILSLRGQLIPVFSLKKLFSGPLEKNCMADGGIIVIVEDENKKAGIVVDELIDQQQIVVKSMGAGLGKTDGIGGCTIMSDGRVGLIIDVAAIIQFTIKGEEVKQ